MSNLDRAIAAAREALRNSHATANERPHWLALESAMSDLLAALDAARGEAVAWRKPETREEMLALVRNARAHLAFINKLLDEAFAEGENAAPPAALAVPAEAMVERALKVLAFEHDGALFPDDYSDEEADAERETMRKVLAAAERKGVGDEA